MFASSKTRHAGGGAKVRNLCLITRMISARITPDARPDWRRSGGAAAQALRLSLSGGEPDGVTVVVELPQPGPVY